MSTGRINAVTHCGNLNARFACRGPASGNGMANDNRTCCACVLSRLIIGTIIDDDEQVNARDCSACAHGRGDLAADIVGADDRRDLLRR